jgi:tetratricopeptide (TPR) repeat protein
VELSRDDPEVLANAYMALAHVLVLQGLHTLARDAARRVLELADDLDLVRQCQAWNQHGHVLLAAGDAEGARRSFLRALELAVRSRDQHHRIKIEGNIGSALWDLGRRKQARSRFLRAVGLARRWSDPASEAFWLIEIGRLDFEEGALEQAAERARAALARAGADAEPLTLFRGEWLLHRIVRRRDPEAPDRQRLAHLRRLYTGLSSHRGIDTIAEFQREVIEPARGRRRKES